MREWILKRIPIKETVQFGEGSGKDIVKFRCDFNELKMKVLNSEWEEGKAE